ncbi:unnamed protein product [Lupinus luteus]|uniref:Uncharacterized protein n=1 Tax=Lupinus luteus TaxID=3873 RepID=A0AAV1XHL4_LUPLU
MEDSNTMLAKQKATGLKWAQLDVRGSIDSKGEKHIMYHNLPLSVTSASTLSSLQGTEIDELLVSSQAEDESQHEQTNRFQR